LGKTEIGEFQNETVKEKRSEKEVEKTKSLKEENRFKIFYL